MAVRPRQPARPVRDPILLAEDEPGTAGTRRTDGFEPEWRDSSAAALHKLRKRTGVPVIL